jgi:tRNA dimethylallyltransferase
VLPVVLLMGPTAAGKTDAALALAKRLPIEIVSVDSAMVYRGFDIGTAKPSPEERARVPHHLVDIREPEEPYSAGQFVRDASAAIAAIRTRGCVPVLVGGTMLYFHALLHGLAELPEGDAELRAELDERGAREGWDVLHAELAAVDPEAAGRIHPNDPQRIQRALEVYRITGTPISRLQSLRSPAIDAAEALCIALSPASRASLHARIEQRFHRMMAAGFLDEVRRLHERAGAARELPALRAVGYRQIREHLLGNHELEAAVHRAIAATRQLAKRQLTWLRALATAHWLDSDARHDVAQVVASLLPVGQSKNS